MGMHLGIIAVQATMPEFRAAFIEVWPNLEIVSSAENFSDVDAIWSWKTANERFVSAADWTKENPGSEVYLLYEDGPWSVLMDFSYVLAGDQEALQQFSLRFGTALSFIVESASGCSFFWCYEDGELKREIQSVDGEVTFSGALLQQEDGIDVKNYYMDETEQLMQAFKLSRPELLPLVATTVALSTVDHTDYSVVNAGSNDQKLNEPKPERLSSKPWWKFW